MEVNTASDMTLAVTAVNVASGGMKFKPDIYGPDSHCYWYTVTLMGLLAILVSLVGGVANILTVMVMWNQVRKSATIFLMVSLALLDLMLLLTHGIMSVMILAGRISLDYALEMKLQSYIYVYLVSIHAIMRLATVWVTVVIMWHRYYAIEANYTITGLSIKKVALQTFGVLSASVLFNIPKMLQYKLMTNSMGIMFFMLTDLGNSEDFKLVYDVIAYYLCYYIVPMGILIAYTVKSVKLMKKKMKGNQHLKSSLQKTEHEISASLVIVIIIFLLSHSLGPIRRVLLLVFNSKSDMVCGGVLFYFNPIIVLLSNVHAVVDFFVYTLRVPRFRKHFIQLFKYKNVVSPTTTSDQTDSQ